MKFFKFYSKNWYYIGGILFVVLSFLIGFFGEAFDPLSKILTLSFMALLVHQFEEYALPGGFPAIMNSAWVECEMDFPFLHLIILLFQSSQGPDKIPDLTRDPNQLVCD
jgi:hypothetical protein